MPDELDRQLDEALSAYAAAPERPGLEQRVLARVRDRKRRGRLWFVFVTAAAAVVAVLIVIATPRLSQKPVPYVEEAVKKEPLPRMAPPVLVPKAAPPPLRQIRVRQAEPKRPVFPTSVPLTPQERALLEIGRSQPAVVASLNRPLEPLNVPLIEIAPLAKEEN